MKNYKAMVNIFFSGYIQSNKEYYFRGDKFYDLSRCSEKIFNKIPARKKISCTVVETTRNPPPRNYELRD